MRSWENLQENVCTDEERVSSKFFTFSNLVHKNGFNDCSSLERIGGIARRQQYKGIQQMTTSKQCNFKEVDVVGDNN